VGLLGELLGKDVDTLLKPLLPQPAALSRREQESRLWEQLQLARQTESEAVAAQAKAEAEIMRLEAELQAARSTAESAKSAAAAANREFDKARAEYLEQVPLEDQRATDAPPEGAQFEFDEQVKEAQARLEDCKKRLQEAQMLAQAKRREHAAAETTAAAEKELQTVQGEAPAAYPVTVEV
jgi:hypothetical protein